MWIRRTILRPVPCLVVTLAVAAGGLAICGGAAQAATSSSATEILLNRNSGMCLGSGSGSAVGTQEVQEPCHPPYVTNLDSLWAATPLLSGRYQVTNGYGLCLGVRGASRVQGAAVEQETCNGGLSQDWTPGGATATDPNFSYELVNANSGMCLGIWYASPSAGATAVQWPCNSSLDQRWNGTWFFGQLTNVATGMCLGVLGASKNDGAQAVQWPCNSSADQVWESDSVNYRIQNSNDGKCLGVLGASQASGAPIVQWACNGSNDQFWPFGINLHPDGKHVGWQFFDQRSGLCLDVPGGPPIAGQQLAQEPCGAGQDQEWTYDFSMLGSNTPIG